MVQHYTKNPPLYLERILVYLNNTIYGVLKRLIVLLQYKVNREIKKSSQLISIMQCKKKL